MNEALPNEGRLRLNNGVMMPSLGFGVYRIAPEMTTEAVLAALRAGYRLIDTAAAYNNEREVGEAVRRSGIPRADIFVTSKLWPTDYGQDAAARALDRSLGKLGLDYVFASSMEEAVGLAEKAAAPGDAVLLSPACASWGMFKNYEERGRIFKELVRK